MTELSTELDLLKERADMMNIGYHPKIGVAALKKKINAQLQPTVVTTPKAQTENELRQKLTLEAKALKRVIILNQNPTTKERKGALISFSNSMVGTISRFIPFDVETHVEAALLKQLKNKQMSRFYDDTNDRGQVVRKYRLVPEFTISNLAPLTSLELKQLAEDQLKRGAID